MGRQFQSGCMRLPSGKQGGGGKQQLQSRPPHRPPSSDAAAPERASVRPSVPVGSKTVSLRPSKVFAAQRLAEPHVVCSRTHTHAAIPKEAEAEGAAPACLPACPPLGVAPSASPACFRKAAWPWGPSQPAIHPPPARSPRGGQDDKNDPRLCPPPGWLRRPPSRESWLRRRGER